jgi:hypothetical protein
MLSVHFFSYISFTLFTTFYLVSGLVLFSFSLAASALFPDVRIPAKFLGLLAFIVLVTTVFKRYDDIYFWDKEKGIYPDIDIHYAFVAVAYYQIGRLLKIFHGKYSTREDNTKNPSFVDWNILKEELYHKIRNDQGVLQLIAIGLLSHFLAW